MAAISFVYAIGPDPVFPGSLVKIRVTTDVLRRLREFQCGSPLLLSVVWLVPGDQSVERWLHSEFSAHRRHGEWFDLGADPVGAVQEKLGPYMVNIVLAQVGKIPFTTDMDDLDSDDFEIVSETEPDSRTSTRGIAPSLTSVVRKLVSAGHDNAAVYEFMSEHHPDANTDSIRITLRRVRNET